MEARATMNRLFSFSIQLFCIALLLCASVAASGQEIGEGEQAKEATNQKHRGNAKLKPEGATPAKGIEVYAQVVEGDTFPVKYLNYVTVVAERQFRDPEEARKWARLKKNVKKVYPYARLAAQKLEDYADELEAVESKRERKKYYKMIEEELKLEYEDDMRDMTMTQGRILIKLIDRETGKTGYGVVKEFRGGFSAFFWQGLAKMFRQDLKSEYDPNGADKDIETVVQLIESGNL